MSVLELIRACAGTNDSAPWEEFVSRFERPISLSVMRTACQLGKNALQVVDDLVQETYLKLCADKCRHLLDFANAHPDNLAVTRYIKVVAINVTLDHFKALHSQKRGEGETDQFPEEGEPSAHAAASGGPDAMDREVLLKQIDDRLHLCAAGPNQARDCLIFWFYYLQGMTAKAMAPLPGIELTPKGVEAVIFRLVRCLRRQLGASSTQEPAAS